MIADSKKALTLFWKFTKPYLGEQIKILFFIVGRSFFALSLPYILKLIIDDALMQRSGTNLVIYVSIFIGFYLMENLLMVLNLKKLAFIRNRLEYDLSVALYKKILQENIYFFQEIKVGEIIQRIMNEVGEIKIIFTDLVVNLITQIITFIIIILIMLRMNIPLTITIMMSVPLLYLHFKFFNPRLQRLQRIIKLESSTFANTLHDQLQGVETLKTYKKEKYSVFIFSRRKHKLISTYVKWVYWKILNEQSLSFIYLIGPILILTFGGYQVLNQTMTLGAFVAFYSYINKLYEPVKIVANVNVQLQKSYIALERFTDILHRPETTTAGEVHKNELEKAVEVNDLSYSHPNGQVVFHSLNFTFHRGKMIGIRGSNGSGKSTFLKVLTNVYNSYTGEVKIDDVSVKQIRKQSMAKLIGSATQNSYLFNLTIRDNITLGQVEWDLEQVQALARMLNLEDDISKLSDGYDTIIENNGDNFSGGQRQKIALLRALYFDPDIILLDEATSEIDHDTERQLFAYLSSIKKEKLIIFISHKPELFTFADEIIEFK